MEYLFLDVAAKPLWVWLVFVVTVITLLVFDLGVLNRGDREIGVARSLKLSAFYIAAAALFGGWVWHEFGSKAGLEYFTGFLVEKSLSLDNVFVIAMIFGFFAIPRELQHRVLFWGILGVLVLRAIMIGLGAALVSQFSWVMFVFGAFLAYTGVQMWRQASAGAEPIDLANNRLLAWLKTHLRVTDTLHGNRFWVKVSDSSTGRMAWAATPLFLCLVLVEAVDLLFAVDSVPAIFAITSDPFIVYTSNIFAILGLRALYFALAAMVERFHYLKYALSAVLVFVGGKIFWTQFFGKPAPWVTLSVTFGLLAAGIAYSLWRTRKASG